MVLTGLGVACSTSVLSPGQLYQLALAAGFPSDTAITMAAVAMRESGGCPTAHNPGSPIGAEDSYGLWQINIKANPLSMFGLTDPSQLYDPATNAQAAATLWGGNDANLDTAWYINRPGYREAYMRYLPTVQAAVQAMGGTALPPLITVPTDYPPYVSAGLWIMSIMLLTR
jgi:hypothetical protein